MKNINKWLAAFAITSVMTACEKQLTDLQPIDQIPAQNAISTLNDVNSAINGVYGTWQGRRASHLSSFISDELRLGTGTEYRNVGNLLFQWTHTSDLGDFGDGGAAGAWFNMYQVIDRANRVLELMVPVPARTPAEIALKNQYQGEMLAARAMAHLELLRWFSITAEYNPTSLGVALQKEFVKAPGAYKPSRNTQAEVMAQITADLAQARTLIPTTFVDISRITRNAVIAAQARAALHTKSWQEVVDRANEVLAVQPITNRAGYAALWTTRTLAANQSTEVIFKLNVQLANLGVAIGSLWQDVGTGAVQASGSDKLMNGYDQVNDIRFGTFFQLAPPRTRRQIAKYGIVQTSPANAENFQFDIKMIRSSEILLARAEAFAELNNLASANTDLAALRSNRIQGYVHTNITDRTTLINAIMQERFLELCFEGQRYFDLRRRSLPIQRDLADAGGLTAITNLPVNNFRYLMPIPLNETLANPNMTQNPGY